MSESLSWKIIKDPSSTDQAKFLEKNSRGVDVVHSKTTTFVDSFFSQFEENSKLNQTVPMRKKRLRKCSNQADIPSEQSDQNIYLHEDDVPRDIGLNPKQFKQYQSMLKEKDIKSDSTNDDLDQDQVFDLWDVNSKHKLPKAYISSQTPDIALVFDEKRVLLNPNKKRRPKKSLSSFHPSMHFDSVLLPHPGASINPTPEEHSDLTTKKQKQIERISKKRASILEKLSRQPEYNTAQIEDIDLSHIETNTAPFPIEDRHRTYKSKPINQKHAVRRQNKQMNRDIFNISTIVDDVSREHEKVRIKNSIAKAKRKSINETRPIIAGSRPFKEVIEVSQSSQPTSLRSVGDLPGNPFRERYKTLVKSKKVVNTK